MLLFRSQIVGGYRFEGHSIAASSRIKGRWFTSSLDRALQHSSRIATPTEIIAVEVDDTIAMSYNVAAIEAWREGISPREHSDAPELDFILPRFRIVQAQTIANPAFQGQADPEYV